MNVKIFEVGPRDGLQNESVKLSSEQKLGFVNLLVKAGHSDIEAGAFVSPERVPQMAGSSEILESLLREKGSAKFWALVPNQRGFDQALQVGIKNIAVFTAASETFNRKNINASIDESFERFESFLPHARKLKMAIRGYVSTAFGCPFEGKISEKAVMKVTERLLKQGAHEISIGDTIGVANPMQVRKLTKKLIKICGPKKLALHFHDTRGTALANVYAGLEEGVRIFDSSSGGLGGCPYAPGATGNVATEDLLYMLHEMRITTGVSLSEQIKASRFISGALGKNLPSRYLQVALKFQS